MKVSRGNPNDWRKEFFLAPEGYAENRCWRRPMLAQSAHEYCPDGSRPILLCLHILL